MDDDVHRSTQKIHPRDATGRNSGEHTHTCSYLQAIRLQLSADNYSNTPKEDVPYNHIKKDVGDLHIAV